MPLLNPTDQADIIATLEAYLVKARSGELGAICVVSGDAQTLLKISVGYAGALLPLALGTDVAHRNILNLLYPVQATRIETPEGQA